MKEINWKTVENKMKQEEISHSAMKRMCCSDLKVKLSWLVLPSFPYVHLTYLLVTFGDSAFTPLLGFLVLLNEIIHP
jgi:hypothetical protein